MQSVLPREEAHLLFDEISSLIEEYDSIIDIGLIGFPACWKAIVKQEVIVQ